MKPWINLLFVFSMALTTAEAQMCETDSQCLAKHKCIRGQCVNMNPITKNRDCRDGYEAIEVRNSNGAYMCVRSMPLLNDAATIHQPPKLELECKPNPACPKKHESICQSGKSMAVCRPE